MAAVTHSPRTWPSRNRLLAVVVAVALVAAYVFLAVFQQPLIADDEGLNRAPGQATVNDPAMSAEIGTTDGRAPVLLTYVDGGEATLVKALYNEGPTPLTVTGVDTSPSLWVGLVTLKDPRAAVIVGPAPCCQLNEAATWSAQDFRSFQINPGERGVIAMHLLTGNCEDSSSGLYVTINLITVHYSVLGFPRAQEVSVGPYSFQSPATCPRGGPRRP